MDKNRMQQIFFANKGITPVSKALSTDDVVRVFESTNDLDEIKEAVEQADERLYVSWAHVELKDKANELIPIEDVANDQDVLLERGGPITDEHTNAVIGRTLAWKMLEHPASGTMGILHLNKIFNHNQLDDQIWSEIINKERTGSSIAGINEGFKPGIDESTGMPVMEMIGFRQYETASVHDPCNYLATNEAFSLVAKSNQSGKNKKGKVFSRRNDIKEPDYKDFLERISGKVIRKNKALAHSSKPAKLDRCVEELMADPDFEPQEGKSKEESAFAVCTAQIEGKTSKNENVINKHTYLSNMDNKNQTGKGDGTMDVEKVLKSVEDKIDKSFDDVSSKMDDFSKSLNDVGKRVEKLEQAAKEEDEDKPKEPKEPEDKPDEEDKKKSKKESAAGDIDGEQGNDKPDSPEPESPNDEDVYKSIRKSLEEVTNRLSGIEKKMEGEGEDEEEDKSKKKTKKSTPRPGSSVTDKTSGGDKAAGINPLDIATGKVKKSWPEINALERQKQEDEMKAFGGVE